MKLISIVTVLLIIFALQPQSPVLAQDSTLPLDQQPETGQTQPAVQAPADSTTEVTPNQNPQSQSGTAQSNTLCIRIGSPSEEKPAICDQPTSNQVNPISSNSQGLAKVLEWDQVLVSSLQTGVWGYYNRMMTNQTNGQYSSGTWPGTSEANLYWCTYSIIDAYRLAGIDGLSKSSHGAVVNMRQFWKTAQGYQYVDYEANNQNIQNVQPGYAMFMELVAGGFTGSEHVNMIKEISLNSLGNGYLITNDSNSSSPSHKYAVAGWRVLNTVYPVRGFGGI